MFRLIRRITRLRLLRRITRLRLLWRITRLWLIRWIPRLRLFGRNARLFRTLRRNSLREFRGNARLRTLWRNSLRTFGGYSRQPVTCRIRVSIAISIRAHQLLRQRKDNAREQVVGNWLFKIAEDFRDRGQAFEPQPVVHLKTETKILNVTK